MKLHLAADPLAVKVCIPPPALILSGRVKVGAGRAGISPTPTRHHCPPSPRLGPHKGDAEEPVLLTGRDDRLSGGRGGRVVITMPAGSRRGLLHDNGGGAGVLVKGRVFLLVLCLPGVVDLKDRIELSRPEYDAYRQCCGSGSGIFNFVKLMATNKGMATNFFLPLSFVANFGSGIRDSGIIWMGKNQDPGSGINIPDPQHCI